MKIKNSRKGISLPINVLIILAVAIIVLVAVVALLLGIWPESTNPMVCQAKFQGACSKFVTAGGCEEDSTVQATDFVDEKTATCLGITWDDNTIKARCCYESKEE